MSPPSSHLHHHHHHCSLSSSSSSVLDSLYCEEEEEQTQSLLPIQLLENDLFYKDEELITLFSKEQGVTDLNVQGSDSMARREAVEWMLMVNSYFGFSTTTAILSVNYLDRFLYKSPHLYQNPWMIQLAAVTCLSLAAKFEEIRVPLLLDLQVEGTKYMFEPKTIQKMELLVLSTLDWKMNPVTPISFFDHIIPRLGLKTHIHYEFLRRCEQILLSVVADSKFVAYLPSVLATATMTHVIDQIQPSNPLDYQNHLFHLLNISKENVKHCYGEIVTLSKNSVGNKREREISHQIAPSSPKGVIDAFYFSSDSSNDSWTLTGGGLSTSASVSSSPDQRVSKKMKVNENCIPLMDVVGITLISILSYLAVCRMRYLVLEELNAFFLIFPLYLWKKY